MSVSSAKGLAENIGIQNLEQVLVTGNDAGGLDISGVDNIALTTINGSAYPPVVSTPTIASVLTAGSVATAGQNLTGLNNVGLTTINGSAYPPAFAGLTNGRIQYSTSTYTTATSSINQVLATVSPLVFPAGTYFISTLVEVNTLGQSFQGISINFPQIPFTGSALQFTSDVLLGSNYPTGGSDTLCLPSTSIIYTSDGVTALQVQLSMIRVAGAFSIQINPSYLYYIKIA